MRNLQIAVLALAGATTLLFNPNNVFAQASGSLEDYRPNPRPGDNPDPARPPRNDDDRRGGGRDDDRRGDDRRGGDRNDPRRPEPNRPDPYRPDPRPGDNPDPYRPDPYRPDPYRPDPYRPDPYRPDPYRPDPRNEEVVSAYIHRYVTNETLALRQLLDLDRNYRGRVLQAVEVEFSMPARPVVIDLLVDGMVVTSQTVYDRSDLRMYLPDDYRIGTDVRTLRLRVRGSLYVREVRVIISDRGYYDPTPGPIDGDIEFYIDRHMFGTERTNLMYLGGLDRYRGYRIQEVIIEAESRSGNADAYISMNGLVSSDRGYVSTYRSRITMRIHRDFRIGMDLNRFELVTRGEMYVGRVIVRLSRY